MSRPFSLSVLNFTPDRRRVGTPGWVWETSTRVSEEGVYDTLSLPDPVPTSGEKNSTPVIPDSSEFPERASTPLQFTRRKDVHTVYLGRFLSEVVGVLCLVRFPRLFRTPDLEPNRDQSGLKGHLGTTVPSCVSKPFVLRHQTSFRSHGRKYFPPGGPSVVNKQLPSLFTLFVYLLSLFIRLLPYLLTSLLVFHTYLIFFFLGKHWIT